MFKAVNAKKDIFLKFFKVAQFTMFTGNKSCITFNTF